MKYRSIYIVGIGVFLLIGAFYVWGRMTGPRQTLSLSGPGSLSTPAPTEPSPEPIVTPEPELSPAPTSDPIDTTPLVKEIPQIKTPDKQPAQNTVDSWFKDGFAPGKVNRAVDTIVVHSSYNAIGGDEFDVAKIFQEYREAGVSPHYLIARDGTLYRLVHERDVAWHAGESRMADGRTNVNAFSIGIEMVGTKTSGYTTAQYTALNTLITDIKTRHTIKYIVGHDDIASGRKTDPWKFDWSRIKR